MKRQLCSGKLAIDDSSLGLFEEEGGDFWAGPLAVEVGMVQSL